LKPLGKKKKHIVPSVEGQNKFWTGRKKLSPRVALGGGSQIKIQTAADRQFKKIRPPEKRKAVTSPQQKLAGYTKGKAGYPKKKKKIVAVAC